ncbi:MAG: ergothioneine biosynthesis glutamate--cysteine ligase EgtA, partial [Gemmatimonadetes bacterium]|nr:ergothioneine biosynthesis glutamate--cysteine ligase EgtA [Gemmatimonadota bacterium]NIQ56959.1 ergothioneine biosynthesis glutamate--cysteine ligase EgtA [Gemmatimonadota bacterium]NIU77130.1 ergothioneine biosynthesis glutamate--cysteine ligase EgtA [Gammaproteobacteria bacterium]NIX46451.1 ergothioneine biosynthesis glutamate--cysteine ligase EgtA [Gemmatimonadota bacterium]NIY10766.1 ergothioneine biosynthesis glutamate--cysteine ligase EgtA [Gemmatimonadota bacterium]
GGRVTFEPGGQVEYASPPLDSLAALATHLQDAVPPLIAGARDAGLELLGCGIDPRTPLEDARLVLPGERYASMHRYLARIGDAGPRMMLQTAAAQVNVELGPHLALRWRVLNAAAPFLTAIFANSRVYQERDTGFASYRARQWRLLDRRRTGILGRGPDPAAEYLDFALNAAWMLAPPDRPAEPFAEWLLRGEVSLDDWRRHLTTLFPEVRPR